MLYPHGLKSLVNNNSHEQDVQTIANHTENGDKPCTQPYVKCNRMRNKFQAYLEMMSDEDVSSEDFIYESQNRIAMAAGQPHQDQVKQLRTRNKADELHLHDHMSDQLLPPET